MSMVGFAALIAIPCSTQVFACSGPGAARAMFKAQLFGGCSWIASIGMIAGATLLRRRRDGGRRVPWLAGLVAIHPGWWMSAYGGDCGAALVSWSLVATTLIGLAAGLALCRSRAGGGASGGMRSLGDALIGTMAGVAVSALILSGPVAGGPAEFLLDGWALGSSIIASVLLGGDLRRARPRPWYRARFRLLTLLMLPAVLAAPIICLFPVRPYTAYVSLSRPFWFLVIDAQTGRPVADAAVRLIDPRFDPGNVEVQMERVVTGPDGRAEFFLVANASGRQGLLGRTETITYHPWLIRVDAPGYRAFVTSLSGDPPVPRAGFTAPPLGMTFPPPTSVTIGLRRALKPGGPADKPDRLPLPR